MSEIMFQYVVIGTNYNYLGIRDLVASIIISIRMFHGNFSNLEKCIFKICSGDKKLNGHFWSFILPYLLPLPPVGNIHFRGFSQSEECSFSNFQGEISRP